MSEKRKPKNVPVEKSEDSDEEPRSEQSPGDAEDKCLLSTPSTGAEALPVASGSGACASGARAKITDIFKKFSSSKKKHRKPKTESSLKKKALSKTFEKSYSQYQMADSDPEEKRGRKMSDPTDLKTKVELKTESEPKKGLFGFSTVSTKKTSTSEETKKKAKKAKDKKGFLQHFSGTASKETSVESDSKNETKPGPSVQKILSPKMSNQSSIGGLSVGLFNEVLASSESSGVSTESTSANTQNVKLGNNSPDAAAKRSSLKRPRAEDPDEDSSLTDSDEESTPMDSDVKSTTTDSADTFLTEPDSTYVTDSNSLS